MKFAEFTVTYPKRCARCFMHHELCLCGVLPSIENRVPLTVVMHHREAYKTTNTARIAHLCLKNSRILLRGHKIHKLQLEEHFPSTENCLFLTLHERAEVLTPELVQSLQGTPHLVVPDGNWRQAGRMGAREPVLKNMRWIKLAPGPLSSYKLRKEPTPEGLGTMEAIARAYGILESRDVQDSLEQAFHLMVERTLKTRPLNRQA